jgi:hypothetical protein
MHWLIKMVAKMFLNFQKIFELKYKIYYLLFNEYKYKLKIYLYL